MKKISKHLIIFIISICVMIGGVFVNYQIQQAKQNKSIREEIANEVAQRSEEDQQAYREFVAQQKEHEQDVQKTEVQLNKDIKKYTYKEYNDIVDATNTIISTLGSKFDYSNYENVNLDILYSNIDEYSEKAKLREIPQYEEDYDNKAFKMYQDAINNLDENSETLWVDVHNLLLNASLNVNYPEDLDWTHWLEMAKKCDYFHPVTEFADVEDVIAVNPNVVYAGSQDSPTTVNTPITFACHQSAKVYSDIDSGSDVTNKDYPNHDRYRRYTSEEDTMVVKVAGLYKFVLTGGKGGADLAAGGGYGGNGGTTIIYRYLKPGDAVYINVGGNGGRTAEGGRYNNRKGLGWAAYAKGGYNGGGRSSTQSSKNDPDYNQGQGGDGGGATSVATASGTLNTLSSNKDAVIAVAGGGAGAAGVDNVNNNGSYDTNHGGVGGGTSGGKGSDGRSNPGTQTEGGSCGYAENGCGAGSFGQGGASNTYTGGGGGGGYYGGGGASFWAYDKNASAAGGSGYIKEASITFNGVKYTNSTTSGSGYNYATEPSGGGSVTVTLIDILQLDYGNKSYNEVYSTAPITIAGEAAEDGSGSYSYTITSQKNSSNSNVSYFSMSGSNIVIAAKAPAGTYTLKVKASDTLYNVAKEATITITINPAIMTSNIAAQVYSVDGNPHGNAINSFFTTIDNSAVTVKYGNSATTCTSLDVPKVINPEDSRVVYFVASAPNHRDVSGSYRLIASNNSIYIHGLRCDGHEGVTLLDDYSGINYWYYTYKYITAANTEEQSGTSGNFSGDVRDTWITFPKGQKINSVTIYVNDKATNSNSEVLTCDIELRTYLIKYNANGHGTAPTNQEKTHNIDINLQGFIPTQYDTGPNSTISFDANGGGTNPSDVTSVANNTYNQTYWAEDSVDGEKFDSNDYYDKNKNATMYALWDKSINYTPVLMPSALERTGYTFKNWNTKDDGTGTAYTANYNYDPDDYPALKTSQTLYAIWQEKDYTITYYGNGATSGVQPVDYRNYSESFTLPTTTNFTKGTDYAFDGWWDAPTGGNRITTIAANTDSNTTVYAHWKSLNFLYSLKDLTGYDTVSTPPSSGEYISTYLYYLDEEYVVLDNYQWLSNEPNYQPGGEIWKWRKSSGTNGSMVKLTDTEMTIYQNKWNLSMDETTAGTTNTKNSTTDGSDYEVINPFGIETISKSKRNGNIYVGGSQANQASWVSSTGMDISGGDNPIIDGAMFDKSIVAVGILADTDWGYRVELGNQEWNAYNGYKLFSKYDGSGTLQAGTNDSACGITGVTSIDTIEPSLRSGWSEKMCWESEWGEKTTDTYENVFRIVYDSTGKEIKLPGISGTDVAVSIRTRKYWEDNYVKVKKLSFIQRSYFMTQDINHKNTIGEFILIPIWGDWTDWVEISPSEFAQLYPSIDLDTQFGQEISINDQHKIRTKAID